MQTDERQMNLALLRCFEPVIRYTRGEHFYPIDVERYISQCSLWVQLPDKPPELLVPQGELSIESLTQPRQGGFGAVYYLRFIEPLDLRELALYSLNKAVFSVRQKLHLGARGPEETFRAGFGRLARVGYGSRFVDALFSITLVLRGRVPGDTAIAAGMVYKAMQKEKERFCYYGRVVRENGWVVLQYWFFYPFNNWRSGFFGVNDHEGDWEMVSIYCSEDDSTEKSLQPRWVAYASHDFSGDDLRRSWDDPEVEKIRDSDGILHPVVYAGAGSHASYFSRGEFLAELELPFLVPLVQFVDKVQAIWVKILQQAGGAEDASRFNVFRIPFVDYARGDGRAIGPGQANEWQPEVLDEHTEWATRYRGLWGLYANDPIAGENAPAGPVYNRDGVVRRSWFDPLGWAGLDKVPPPDQTASILRSKREEILVGQAQLREKIEHQSQELVALGVEAAAMQSHPHLEQAHYAVTEQIGKTCAVLRDLRKEMALQDVRLEALNLYQDRIERGDPVPLRAHIHRAHQPSSDKGLPQAKLAEFVAAVSIGLLMVAVVLLIAFARNYLLIGLAILIGVMIFVEAGFRGQLVRLINSLTVGLAVVTAFVLLFEFFWQIVVLAVITAGFFIMWENLRELRT
jgi:hypothetical protein